MTLPAWIQDVFIKSIHFIFAHYPQPIPDKDQLSQCKLISHRGAYDNRQVFENTLSAFDRIKDTGVWGIEFDIRWTKDLTPIVFHDRHLNRLFGVKRKINQIKLSELKASFPMIPTLKEIIDRYGQQLHLLVEIKEEFYPNPTYQGQVLEDLFSPLRPKIDFHCISLSPKMFQLVEFLPDKAFLPIAEINVASVSEIVLKKKYQGILGHYLLITDAVIKKHRQNNQIVGTGLVNSKNCLLRELNRGITWIFSQNALEMQAVRGRLLNNI